MRISYSPELKDGEAGVYCQCGRCLFFPKEELTPPITIIKCPECGFVIEFLTSMTIPFYDDESGEFIDAKIPAFTLNDNEIITE